MEKRTLGVGLEPLERGLRHPGTTKPARLAENLGAVSVELTRDDLRDIERAASNISVEGARYPEHLERLTGR
jgi:aryl-alcohol dehydrogenase-like predicted oxidoreductase